MANIIGPKLSIDHASFQNLFQNRPSNEEDEVEEAALHYRIYHKNDTLYAEPESTLSTIKMLISKVFPSIFGNYDIPDISKQIFDRGLNVIDPRTQEENKTALGLIYGNIRTFIEDPANKGFIPESVKQVDTLFQKYFPPPPPSSIIKENQEDRDKRLEDGDF